RDLGLADPRGPRHDDVLGPHILAHRLGQLLTPPAVSHRDGHGALGGLLADDVLVQFRNNLLGRHAPHDAPEYSHFEAARRTRAASTPHVPGGRGIPQGRFGATDRPAGVRSALLPHRRLL